VKDDARVVNPSAVIGWPIISSGGTCLIVSGRRTSQAMVAPSVSR
jgi:hypothetical protein